MGRKEATTNGSWQKKFWEDFWLTQNKGQKTNKRTITQHHPCITDNHKWRCNTPPKKEKQTKKILQRTSAVNSRPTIWGCAPWDGQSNAILSHWRKLWNGKGGIKMTDHDVRLHAFKFSFFCRRVETSFLNAMKWIHSGDLALQFSAKYHVNTTKKFLPDY